MLWYLLLLVFRRPKYLELYRTSVKSNANQFHALNFPQVIDDQMQNQEKLKNSRITVRSQVDDKEGEVAEVRKRLGAQQKEITSSQKGITALETKLEQKRSDRHSLLKSCKVIISVK